MRKLTIVSIIIFAAACTANTSPVDSSTSDTNGAGGDGPGTVDAAAVGDAGAMADASYAPCPTCCDPILQNCPTAGSACYPTNVFGGKPTACLPSGSTLPGFRCVPHPTSSECVPGSECGPLGDGTGGAVCTKLCVNNSGCPMSQTCHPYAMLAYGTCS
jgi:hypothetical protein